MCFRRWSLLSLIALSLLAPVLAACTTPAPPTPTLAATAEANLEPAPETTEVTVAIPPTTEPPTAEPPTAEPPTAEPTATEPPTPEPTATATGPAPYAFRVVATYPHDVNAWTQGLVIDQGTLFEGTGRWGESSVREVALETGLVLRSVPLDAEYYGEGITVLGDRIFQLTWQENTGFIYDRNTFDLLETFSYPTEGWGITDDGERLIVSDGTGTLYFWDPQTLTEIGRLLVRDDIGPLNRLNELEFINGEIWANIWLEDRIARISPETGEVLGYIDLTGLLDETTLTQPADVLNGIAFDEATGRIFVTGKLWPALFEIEVIPAP